MFFPSFPAKLLFPESENKEEGVILFSRRIYAFRDLNKTIEIFFVLCTLLPAHLSYVSLIRLYSASSHFLSTELEQFN